MLTALAVKNASPGDEPYRMADFGGLHLMIAKTGTKSWQLKHRTKGRETILTLGRYPAMSLADARLARDAVKKDTALPPVTILPVRTFEDVGKEWHSVMSPKWATRHGRKTLESLAADVFPAFGSTPIAQIKASTVLKMIRAIEARGAAEHARKVLQRVRAVFSYALVLDLIEINPAADISPHLAPQTKGRMPAIVGLEEARSMLMKVESIPAKPITRLAMRLLALTALRQGELRGGLWAELEGLDGETPTWQVPASRMKMKLEHVVPLSRQAVETLVVLRRLTGGGPLLFPSDRSIHKPMSENALGYLLTRAGFQGQHVPHGWRSSFSTILNERYPDDRGVIDLMLAHKPKDVVERAYNRSRHMARRRELSQLWADLLLNGLPGPETLIELPRR